MKKSLSHFILILTLASCQPAIKSLNAQSDLDQVPLTFEDPMVDLQPALDLPEESTAPTKFDVPAEVKPDQTKPKPQSNSDQTETASNTQKPMPVVQKISKFISLAEKIMQTEGRKLGTACNFYVHRVLEAAGFKHELYRANDFDIYAKKHFAHYKALDFKYEKAKSDVARLKKHLWSYPERTPFIIQWSRSGNHGHIAIVERIGEKLVIFQSSLYRHLPRKDQTKPEILLSGYGRNELTVYSEMTPRF